MTTAKRRLNISLSPKMEMGIKELAKRDKMPEATKAAELLRVALEIYEDQIWDKVAGQRDKRGVKFVSHKKAWA